jgi:cytochrome oxidase assembly protein ShyY1
VKLRIALIVLALAILTLLLRLGFWQLARAEEKQQALQSVQSVLQEKHAVALESALRQVNGYSWVDGRLNFSPDPLLLLDNQRRGEQVGVTVFQAATSSDGQTVLVDLGWLAVNGQRQLPKPAALTGTLQISGLLLPPPASGFAMGKALVSQTDGSLLLTRFESKAIADALKRPISARVLRVDPAMAIGFKRDLDIQANTLPPEKHRAYALQWFGLAAAFTILCIGLLFRKKNDNG